MVGVAGFEPAASCSQGTRANQAALHPAEAIYNRGHRKAQAHFRTAGGHSATPSDTTSAAPSVPSQGSKFIWVLNARGLEIPIEPVSAEEGATKQFPPVSIRRPDYEKS